MITLRGVCASSEVSHDKQAPCACKTCGQGRLQGYSSAASTRCPYTADHYKSVLLGACEQGGRTIRRDSYRSVEGIISYSEIVAPYVLRGLPAPRPPVGPWGHPVTARPWAIKGPGRRRTLDELHMHTLMERTANSSVEH
jgi:hypothetical protein